MTLAERISGASKDGSAASNIAAARDAFFHTSNAINELHQSFGHTGEQEYFLTFCPMAHNNQGAHWLQTVDTVYNSFYGESMLRCG